MSASFGNENEEMSALLAVRGSGLFCVACTPIKRVRVCACACVRVCAYILSARSFESRRDYSLSSRGLSGN